MQIVINISEKLYDEIKRQSVPLPHVDVLCKSVLNGTPLPEGHGRLIDADALGEKLHGYTEAPYQYALTVFNESSTIIKADKR